MRLKSLILALTLYWATSSPGFCELGPWYCWQNLVFSGGEDHLAWGTQGRLIFVLSVTGKEWFLVPEDIFFSQPKSLWSYFMWYTRFLVGNGSSHHLRSYIRKSHLFSIAQQSPSESSFQGFKRYFVFVCVCVFLPPFPVQPVPLV